MKIVIAVWNQVQAHVVALNGLNPDVLFADIYNYLKLTPSAYI